MISRGCIPASPGRVLAACHDFVCGRFEMCVAEVFLEGEVEFEAVAIKGIKSLLSRKARRLQGWDQGYQRTGQWRFSGVTGTHLAAGPGDARRAWPRIPTISSRGTCQCRPLQINVPIHFRLPLRHPLLSTSPLSSIDDHLVRKKTVSSLDPTILPAVPSSRDPIPTLRANKTTPSADFHRNRLLGSAK